MTLNNGAAKTLDENRSVTIQFYTAVNHLKVNYKWGTGHSNQNEMKSHT